MKGVTLPPQGIVENLRKVRLTGGPLTRSFVTQGSVTDQCAKRTLEHGT